VIIVRPLLRARLERAGAAAATVLAQHDPGLGGTRALAGTAFIAA